MSSCTPAIGSTVVSTVKQHFPEGIEIYEKFIYGNILSFKFYVLTSPLHLFVLLKSKHEKLASIYLIDEMGGNIKTHPQRRRVILYLRF